MGKRLLLLATVLLAVRTLTQSALADDMVARGKYLATLGDCEGCHTLKGHTPFAGGRPFTALFGTVYSPNITQDRATGIGKWSEADFYRALHKGVGAGGRHLYPAFPYAYFTKLSRADTHALFAYVKTIKPVRAVAPANRVYFPFNIRALMWFWNLLFLDDHRFQPHHARSAAWNRGGFIVNGLGHCGDCHTPKNILFAGKKDEAFSGTTVGGWFAANLTSNRHDGLGKWSAADIVKYLRTGRNAYAAAAGAMQEKVTTSTSHMTDSDLVAIATYLKSLPPKHPVHPAAPDPRVMAAGKTVFVQSCSACHAEGPARDYPRLGGDTLLAGRDPTTVLRIIVQGSESARTPGDKTGYSMPGFAALKNSEIANVATFIRNSWGNRAPPVTADQVSNVRDVIIKNP